MNKEKIFLALEYDKKSPLFGVAANIKYEEKEYLKAAEICSEGLKNFPNHTGGYIVFGKTLAALGEFKYAEKCFWESSRILGDLRLFDIYKSMYIANKSEIELDELQKEKIKNIINDFFGEESDKIIVEKAETTESKAEALEDRLEALAEELKKAKIVPVVEEEDEKEQTIKSEKSQESEFSEYEEKESEEDDEPQVVTETLARIYVSQGNFKGALKIYEKLKELDPERSEYFQDKINEIKTQVGDWW